MLGRIGHISSQLLEPDQRFSQVWMFWAVLCKSFKQVSLDSGVREKLPSTGFLEKEREKETDEKKEATAAAEHPPPPPPVFSSAPSLLSSSLQVSPQRLLLITLSFKGLLPESSLPLSDDLDQLSLLLQLLDSVHQSIFFPDQFLFVHFSFFGFGQSLFLLTQSEVFHPELWTLVLIDLVSSSQTLRSLSSSSRFSLLQTLEAKF